MQEETFKTKKILESGQVNGGAIFSVIVLIVGVTVAVLLLIFSGALSGQTYNLVEEDLDAITNETVKEAVKNSVVSGFEALEQTGNYLPLVVLAVITALIIGIILSFTNFTNVGGGRRGGSVL